RLRELSPGTTIWPESPPWRRPVAESSRSPPRCFSAPWQLTQARTKIGWTSRVYESSSEAPTGPARRSQPAIRSEVVLSALIMPLSCSPKRSSGGICRGLQTELGVPLDLRGGQRAVVDGQLVQAALKGADLRRVLLPLLQPADQQSAR